MAGREARRALERGHATTGARASLLACVLLATLAAAPLPRAWRHWQYSRAIATGSVETARLVSVAIPITVSRNAQPALCDLRVIDDTGKQVPYLLTAPPGSPSAAARSVVNSRYTFSKGQYSQVILDIGPNVRYHNALSFGTKGPDYVLSAEVATSDNGTDWHTVVGKQQIFGFEQSEAEIEQTVAYPDSNARYIRLRINQGAQPFQVMHPTVEYREPQAEQLAPVGVEFTPVKSAEAGRSSWSLDAGAYGVPSAEIDFGNPAGEFRRRVEIRAGPQQPGSLVAAGEIYRLEREGQVFERLSIPLESYGNWGRYWTVDVINGDDSPIEGLRPVLYAVPRRIIFWQQPGRTYSLLYGQIKATAPVYDLGWRTDPKQMAEAAAVSLGPEDVNSDYEPPIAWSERHPSVMWTALALSILILGYAAIRSLSGGRPPASN
jgi:Protein of unknown function (DUF3999)